MDLLTTKLTMPPLRPNLVERPHLLQRLDEGVHHGRRLTLVSAPAGYGKTTLVAGWLSQIAGPPGSNRPPRCAWLTLDRDENDPARFFAYLAAALESAGMTAIAGDRPLWEMTPQPPVETLVTAVINAISHDADERPLLVTLDDYHKIDTPAIHDGLQFWLDHAPPGLHLILITREDPPLTLARWRVRSQMTELRAGDLRFSAAETAGFLNDIMHLSLTAAEITALEQRTEGWVAGLQLAALALQSPQTHSHDNAAGFIAAFSGSHHYVIDYLVEEVLRQQAEDVRAFLRQTAVLNRFNPALCDAVTGRSDSRDLLAYLERNNLFLVPLDSQRSWYRYHQLLADSLLTGLDMDTRAACHRRAAAWFAAQAHYPEAIDHAAAAGDTPELVRLVRLAAEPALQDGRLRQIAGWLALLPDDTITGDLELGVYWLLSLILTGRSREAPAAIAALEQQATAGQHPRQTARLHVIKAWVADITGSEERVALAQQAVQALGNDDPLFSAFVSVPRGHAYLQEGRLPEAIDVFRNGLALSGMRGATFVRFSLLGNLIHTLNLAGRRREAETLCSQALDELVDGQGDPLPAAGLPTLLSAWLNYDANRLAEAQQLSDRSRQLLRQAFQETMLSPLEIELPALLHAAAGNVEAAQAAVQDGRRRATAQQYAHGIRSAQRIEAELQLRHGRYAVARRWAATHPIFAGRQPGGAWEQVEPNRDTAYLTYTRLLLADGQADEARALLPLLAKTAGNGGFGRSLIAIRLLQAVVASDPLPLLREAVQRGDAEGYLRLLIDECSYAAHGPHLQQLLEDPAVRAAAPAFVDRVRAAMPADATAQTTSTAVSDAAALLEPLTDQEQVVLRLLAAGLSNREIAAELVITVGTAKWHVHNIYQKLNVTSRAEAVARVHAWKLLE